MRTIRTEIADRIEAIAPGTLPADPFVRWRPDAAGPLTFRDWANANPLAAFRRFEVEADRKSTRLNSSHVSESRMPSSA